MSQVKKITGSEMTLLNILLKKKNPVVVSEILIELHEMNIDWAHQTVSTFLKRLEEKEVVASTKKGKLRYFYAIVAKEDVENDESKNVVERHFQGSLSNFLSAFTQKNKINADEIQKIKEWADNLDDE